MFTSAAPSRDIFTVSKLNRLAKTILESEIGQIWLSAEISNFVAAASGHWYFTLKDQRAQVRAAMFKGSQRRVMQPPKNGDKVLVRASISLYEPRGDYQLIVEHLEPEGEGLLKQQFEQLKIKLSAEGLFAQQNKQPLPSDIRKVGVVTSATGAALHDILTVLNRRNPTLEVIVYPTQVQGNIATAQICQAIEIANVRNEVDVLIVGRGGGSLEDLWCFNEEALARAIFASQLPVISAVGHEVDVTIADFVADLRAPTPSAAAELVSRDRNEVLEGLNQLRQRLLQTMRTRFSALQQQLNHQEHRLQQQHPKRQLSAQYQRIDQLEMRLHSLMDKRLHLAQQFATNLRNRLQQRSPSNQLQRQQAKVEQLQQNLGYAMVSALKSQQARLGAAAKLLDTVSPLSTLARGYSISFKGDELLKSVSQLQPGDIITNRLTDGVVDSQILAIRSGKTDS